MTNISPPSTARKRLLQAPCLRQRGLQVVRSGSLYLSVLGVSFIISVLAIAGMRAARVHLQATTSEFDLIQARLLAQSAIELGIATLQNDPAWRTNFLVDTAYPATAVSAGGGTFSWRLKSAGGIKRTMRGTGTVGDATCTLEVDLAQPPYLGCALLADGSIQVDSGCTLTCENSGICTNGGYDNQGATTSDLHAQSFTGNSISGSALVPGTQRVLPTPSMMLEYYESKGTEIQPPVAYGNTIISGTILSPNSSWAATNADGIYIIDTQGNDLEIAGCRIVGTLVVTNLSPGKKVLISGDVNWEPAYPHYPALLVVGELEIDLYDDGLVSESSISLNPTGTPFKGVADTDQTDEYISSIAGIIYCSGDLTIRGNGSSDEFPDLRGLVLAGGAVRLRDLTLPTIKYDDTFATTPPPGFDQTDDVVIVPGSWRRVAGP